MINSNQRIEMKYIASIMSIFLVFVVSGCNSNVDSGKFGLPTFDLSGDVDLSLYFTPDGNVTATYKKEVWINNNGSKSFDGDGNESYPVYVYSKNANRVTRRLDSDTDAKLVFVTNEKNVTVINQTEDGNITQYYARFVDKNDPILYDVSEIIKNGNKMVQESSCKLVDKGLSQAVLGNDYDKVISIVCDINKTTTSSFDGDKIVKKTTTTYSGFFSKDKGLIKQIKESCTNKTINGKVFDDGSCEKTVLQLINIIK